MYNRDHLSMEADTCLILFDAPTGNALLAIIDALYSAALARKVETSFLAIRNSSKRFSTLVVTSSALTYKKKLQNMLQILVLFTKGCFKQGKHSKTGEKKRR